MCSRTSRRSTRGATVQKGAGGNGRLVPRHRCAGQRSVAIHGWPCDRCDGGYAAERFDSWAWPQDIHEAPRISRTGSLLQEGHVVTVEPGLYYPGLGAVRIEDMVLVTKDGCRNLTDFPKLFELQDP
ncbi:MAG: M24 family metallopeptidase [Nitrospira sp.]|nr:M24 family metallopeptidase [Nitrospira sp.]